MSGAHGASGCNCHDGCCEGTRPVTPLPLDNPPGLPALRYRAGTHATFLETMLARLSSADFPALAALKTRDPADPAIAWMDGWATVADVLTFYQERVANEGYLRTATERRSILALADLVGYRLRPGVAASVYLAYTLDEDLSTTPPTPTATIVPQGSLSQSVPVGTDPPQYFETSEDLEARSRWNNLQPALTQPPQITLKENFLTDAATRPSLFFDGIATSLKPGDAILIVLGDEKNRQTLRWVAAVNPDMDRQRTEVTLQTPPLLARDGGTVLDAVTATLKQFVDNVPKSFADSSIANQVSALLQGSAGRSGLLDTILAATPPQDAAARIRALIPQVQSVHDRARERHFTRLEPWLAELLDTLRTAAEQLSAVASPSTPPASGGETLLTAVKLPPPPSTALDRLGALLGSLELPPSLQPANSARLQRNITQAFSEQSDVVPQLLGSLKSIASPLLYRALAGAGDVRQPATVEALRLKAGLFANNFAGAPVLRAYESDPPKYTTEFRPPDVEDAAPADANGSRPSLALDAVYDKIVPGTWVAIRFPVFDAAHTLATTYHKVTAVQTLSRATPAPGGFAARVTVLTLDPPWQPKLPEAPAPGGGGLAMVYNPPHPENTPATVLLRQTVVYAQTEELKLTEEPLDEDLQDKTIELDGVYDGLKSGRWIIVSGTRTDIAVPASELVMLAGIEQKPSGSSGRMRTFLTLANSLAYRYDLGSVKIYGNVVKATNGRTRQEPLGNGDGSQTFQSFGLKQAPLTFVPGSNPTGVDTTLEVYVNNVRWHQADSLVGLGPKDRKFIAAANDSDMTTVTFGDGVHGARLPTGTGNVRAVYRNGIGAVGNVAAGQISLLQTRPLNVRSVINPLRASGGADRDSRDQARRNAPLAVMALDRLVAVRDYADFSRTFAGIGKASAARLSDGLRTVVHVTIAGEGDIPIDTSSDLYRNLVQALLVNGDPYELIQVGLRELKLLVIAAGVCILPDYVWEPVAAAVRTALLTAFAFDARDLGQPVFQSEVIAVMQAVPGVAYVDLQTLDAVAESVSVKKLAALEAGLRLRTYVGAELARINPRSSAGAMGRIQSAELAYLTPTLPDTLILNEVKP